MEDRSIIKLFFDRSPKAVEALAQAYGGLCAGIIRGVLGDERDVGECLNDVYLAVWNSVPPNEPEYLSAYVCKIARRVAINRYKYRTRQKRGTGYETTLSELEDCLPAPVKEGGESDERLREILSGFVKALDRKTRVLFVRRYVYFESVKSLAARFAMSENAVSARLHRARKRLKKLLKKEGVRI